MEKGEGVVCIPQFFPLQVKAPLCTFTDCILQSLQRLSFVLWLGLSLLLVFSALQLLFCGTAPLCWVEFARVCSSVYTLQGQVD